MEIKTVFQRYLKYTDIKRAKKPYLRALVGLDRRALEDIGVPPQEIALVLPSAVTWSSAVIASGLSARWSLSGDWDQDSTN